MWHPKNFHLQSKQGLSLDGTYVQTLNDTLNGTEGVAANKDSLFCFFLDFSISHAHG